MCKIVLADADNLAGPGNRRFELNRGQFVTLFWRGRSQHLPRQIQRLWAGLEKGKHVGRQARVQPVQIVYSLHATGARQRAKALLPCKGKR